MFLLQKSHFKPILCLLALLACVGSVSAWTESYQGQTNSTWINVQGGAAWAYPTASIIADPSSPGNYYLQCLYGTYGEHGSPMDVGTVIVGQSDASQYMAFTLFDNQQNSYYGHGMYGSLSIRLYDRYYNVIGTFTNLNATPQDTWGELYTQGRYEIKRTASTGSTVLYFNGVPTQTIITTTEPFNFGLHFDQKTYGHTLTDYVCIDDVIQESQSLNGGYIVGGIPANWWVQKDVSGLTVNGLYNNASTVVSTSAFNTSYGKPSADTRVINLVSSNQNVWQTQTVNGYSGYSTFNLTSFIEGSAPYGEYWLQFESEPDYNVPIWYIGAGASVSWDKAVYVTGSTAKINYNISNTYYDTSTYSYKIAVMNLYGEYLGTNITITEASGSVSKILDSSIFTTGAYYAEIIATSKSTSSEILMNYDMMEVTEYVYLSGYVVNQDNVALQGASVNVTQGTSTLVSVSNASGYYSSSNNWLSGSQINMTTNLSGYTSDYAVFSPLAADTITRNITLVNSTPVYSGVAIGGVVKDSQYQSTVPGASVYERINGTSATPASTTANGAGYYIFNGLVNGTTYDIWSQKTGYANSTVVQKLAVGI